MPFEQLGFQTMRDVSRNMRAMRWSMENYADRIQQHMQSHAPWQDQTRDARRALRAVVTETDGPGVGFRSTITMDYEGLEKPIPYAKYLETMQAGRFSILRPTADVWGPRIRRRMRDLSMGRGLMGGV